MWLQTAVSKQERLGDAKGDDSPAAAREAEAAPLSQEQVHLPVPLPSPPPAPAGKAKGCVEEMALLGQERSQGSIPA